MTEEIDEEKSEELNWQFPLENEISYERHIVGVSNYNDGF